MTIDVKDNPYNNNMPSQPGLPLMHVARLAAIQLDAALAD